MLVLSLDFATLVTALGAKSGVKDQLGSSQGFVSELDGSCQLVVSGPFLGQSQAIVGTLVLGFQGSGDFAGLGVGRAAGFEFHTRGRLGFDVQLEQAEVVSFAENVTGGLAEISVGWWGHFCLDKLKGGGELK